MDLRKRIDNRPGDRFELPVHLARPLFVAARTPYPATVIRLLLERFGFDGLSYVVARGDGRATTGEIAWSTHPRSWSVLYRRAAYAAVDPRLTHTRHRVMPYLWDSADPVDDGHARRFVQDAAQFGIRSGVVVSLHDGASGHVALTFDSASSPITDARREEVIASLGDLTLLAMALHEGVLSWRVAKSTAREHAGPRLTQRECDCLKFAARGMTSADIGNKLSVTERTVNFHFGRLRRKLGALNRPEAIAKGVSMGFVTLD
jgi:DNA-binding CsgD family transcriptional regulator